MYRPAALYQCRPLPAVPPLPLAMSAIPARLFVAIRPSFLIRSCPFFRSGRRACIPPTATPPAAPGGASRMPSGSPCCPMSSTAPAPGGRCGSCAPAWTASSRSPPRPRPGTPCRRNSASRTPSPAISAGSPCRALAAPAAGAGGGPAGASAAADRGLDLPCLPHAPTRSLAWASSCCCRPHRPALGAAGAALADRRSGFVRKPLPPSDPAAGLDRSPQHPPGPACWAGILPPPHRRRPRPPPPAPLPQAGLGVTARPRQAAIRALARTPGRLIVDRKPGEATIMLGLMQDRPLLISSVLEHAARNHGGAKIVSARPDGSLVRHTWPQVAARAAQLAHALAARGVQPRRAHRHAGLERAPAPRDLLRRLLDGRRAAHGEPAALPRPDRLHPEGRRRHPSVRRPDPAGGRRGAGGPAAGQPAHHRRHGRRRPISPPTARCAAASR